MKSQTVHPEALHARARRQSGARGFRLTPDPDGWTRTGAAVRSADTVSRGTHAVVRCRVQSSSCGIHTRLST
eukprot:COSAG02_NODE_364_length_23758_cov_17.250011_12_plen_72_part_00